jgi:hypothetical protein
VCSWLHKNRRERNTGSLPDPADHRSDRALGAALHENFVFFVSKVNYQLCLKNNLHKWCREKGRE